jgi:hypothetical protein
LETLQIRQKVIFKVPLNFAFITSSSHHVTPRHRHPAALIIVCYDAPPWFAIGSKAMTCIPVAVGWHVLTDYVLTDNVLTDWF